MSVTDICTLSVTDKRMVLILRGEVRERLIAAALELFQRDGYELTTAAQIATAAGVTERTFFRYFPDKREVLFGATEMVRESVVAGVLDAPAGLGPLDTLFHAYDDFRTVIEARREYAEPRQELISKVPALQERELAKIAELSDAVAVALETRGVARLSAVLAAQVGMAAIAQAQGEWLRDDSVSLAERFRLAREELGRLL
jgi:AcrR family transcriptional regulator